MWSAFTDCPAELFRIVTLACQANSGVRSAHNWMSGTTAYKPQANGLAERMMNQLLRAATYEGSCWLDVLPHAEMVVNNAA